MESTINSIEHDENCNALFKNSCSKYCYEDEVKNIVSKIDNIDFKIMHMNIRPLNKNYS